ERARSSALGEVGKALALDPTNTQALGTLVQLLTTPPVVMPTEIVLEQRGELERNLRRGGIVAAIVYGYVSLNGFLTWRLGVHDVRAFAIAHAVWGLAFLSSLVMVFRPSNVALLFTFACAIANCAFITTVYSPYLLVPTLITLHATLFAFVRDWTP